MPSLFGLAPGGVFHAFFVTKKPVRSYRTFSPLPWLGGLFSVALSLRSPSPEVIWHRIFVEPGLSSPTKIVEATNQLSGIDLIMQKIGENQELFYVFFAKSLDIIKHSLSSKPLINSFLKCLWKAFIILEKTDLLLCDRIL